jgi:hypothetical protein
VRRAFSGGVVALFASLLLVPAVPAAITVGQIAGTPSEVAAAPACDSGTWAVTSTGVPPRYEIPGDGVLTSWMTYTGATVNQGPVRLKVIRPVSATKFNVMAASAYITPIYLSDGANGPFAVRIPVVANDLIALGVGPRTGTQTMPACQFNNSLVAGSMAKIGVDDPPDAAEALTWGAASHPTYRVSISATLEPDLDHDGFGDETQDNCLGTAGAQAGCPPAGGPEPVLAAIGSERLAPRSFAAAPRGPSAVAARRRYGAKVTYTLNQPASTRFTVVGLRRGRKAGNGRCVVPTRRNRTARRCTRAVTLRGSFTRAGKLGSNSFRFTGRIGGRRLRPGAYQLVATPAANGETGLPVDARFRIIK